MISRSVVPNHQVIGIPLDSDLQLMILHQKPLHVVDDHLALDLSHRVDALHVVPHCIHGFPARDGVGAHAGMGGAQFRADVLGRAAGSGPHAVDDVLGIVAGGHECCGKGFEVGCEGWG